MCLLRKLKFTHFNMPLIKGKLLYDNPVQVLKLLSEDLIYKFRFMLTFLLVILELTVRPSDNHKFVPLSYHLLGSHLLPLRMFPS